MKSEFPYRMAVSFPGELDYIPLVRKLISDILQVLQFSKKFTFRSEFIVDELCNNAVTYGASDTRSAVEIVCEVFADRVEFTVKDQGGSKENIRRLRQAVDADPNIKVKKHASGAGLEMVQMLAEDVTCSIDEHNVTQIHVVRKREDAN
jgi:anti-sigma regulatory factor (Ser/Thr protein kinase)